MICRLELFSARVLPMSPLPPKEHTEPDALRPALCCWASSILDRAEKAQHRNSLELGLTMVCLAFTVARSLTSR